MDRRDIYMRTPSTRGRKREKEIIAKGMRDKERERWSGEGERDETDIKLFDQCARAHARARTHDKEFRGEAAAAAAVNSRWKIDFSARLCEMKPAAAATAINNDKNNPIRRLFDLSATIFFEICCSR